MRCAVESADYSYDALLEEVKRLRATNRDMRDASRDLLRRMCEAIAREMALRAELARLRDELLPPPKAPTKQ